MPYVSLVDQGALPIEPVPSAPTVAPASVAPTVSAPEQTTLSALGAIASAPAITVNVAEQLQALAQGQGLAPGQFAALADTTRNVAPVLFPELPAGATVNVADQLQALAQSLGLAPGEFARLASPPGLLDTGAEEDPDSDLVIDLFGIELFGNPPLEGQRFVADVRARCERKNLDDLAVFANAIHEGIGGGIGDNGTSYGPWQLHKHGRLPVRYWSLPDNNDVINAWAWSQLGIEYALRGMARVGASGLHGHAAVRTIVEDFESPANTQAQYNLRADTYDQLANMPAGVYDYIAGLARGPRGAFPHAQPPSVAPPAAMQSWRDLLDFFISDVPDKHAQMKRNADSLREVFR